MATGFYVNYHNYDCRFGEPLSSAQSKVWEVFKSKTLQGAASEALKCLPEFANNLAKSYLFLESCSLVWWYLFVSFFVANRLHFYADTSEEADLKIWIPSSRHVERSVSKTFRAPYRRSACAFRAHISSSDVPIAESIYRIGQIRYLLSERIWTSSSIIECAHWILSS